MRSLDDWVTLTLAVVLTLTFSVVLLLWARILIARVGQRRLADGRGPARPPTTPLFLAPDADPALQRGLGIAALRAAAVGDPVNVLQPRRRRREARTELRAWLSGEAEEWVIGTDVRQQLRSMLRKGLGSHSEVISPPLRHLEEVLRQRQRAGPELWHHVLDEFAVANGLLLTERDLLHRLAEDTKEAESQLRASGVLGVEDQVPSVLAVDWASSVHAVRTGLCAAWIDEADAAEYVRRAGDLVAARYPAWRVVVAALLLPDLVADNRMTVDWGIEVARVLLDEPASPWQTPLIAPWSPADDAHPPA